MGFVWSRTAECETECESGFYAALKEWDEMVCNIPYGYNEVEKAWVYPYFDERTRGHAILQRRRRLIDLSSAEPKETRQEFQETPPDYSVVRAPSEAERIEEVETLTAAFWESNLKQYNMLEERPDTPRLYKIHILDSYKDQYGRPYSWVRERTKCADSGGCCGRECKCCEQPLLVYDRPSSFYKPAEITGVYGHCTSECPCCVALKGKYVPHPELPPTVVLPETNLRRLGGYQLVMSVPTFQADVV